MIETLDERLNQLQFKILISIEKNLKERERKQRNLGIKRIARNRAKFDFFSYILFEKKKELKLKRNLRFILKEN